MLHDPFGTSRTSRNFKLLVIASCLGTLVFLGLEAFREHLGGEWRPWQLAYARKLAPEFQDSFELGIKQEYLPDLERVDRCRTCHLGVDDPAFSGEDEPLRTHAAHLLDAHPIQDFGCTICHQGQGPATARRAAHGDVPHWEEPLLRGHTVYTSCGLCHAENSLFGDEAQEFGHRIVDREIYASDVSRGVPGAEMLNAGKGLAASSGCLGCHTYRGRGGTLGPDLTHVGDKTIYEYDFTHLDPEPERSALAWLKAHFVEPGAVVPGTIMPGVGASGQEAEALATYMISLKKSTVPPHYRRRPADESREPLDGRGLYELFCVACHGRELDSGEVPAILTPSLSNPDFLAVATPRYLEAMIADGRSGTAMQPWGEGGGGLTAEQVARIAAYVGSYAGEKADLAQVLKLAGDPASGADLFAAEGCSACHGGEGQGGLGTKLRSPEMLSVLSDEMIARTVIGGRPDTGMPSGVGLGAQQVADLVAFIRSWQEPGADLEEVAALLRSGAADAASGARTYGVQCARCHGDRGEGGIGPSLDQDAFLSIASDEFLAFSIRDGRPGTAMPAFRALSAAEIAGLIAFVRGLGGAAYREPPPLGSAGGDVEYGELVYGRACAACHGREGAGGIGPQIANPAFLAHASDAFLRAAMGPRRHAGVPGAEGLADLTEGRILDILAYLRSLQGTALIASSLRAVAGDAERGRRIYEGKAACAKCHGLRGEGGEGQAIGSPAFQQQTTEGFLIAAMVLGKEGTTMPAFGAHGPAPLTVDELRDVAAYVRTLPASFPAGREGWRVRPRTAEQIEAGRQLFEQSCTTCHEPAEGAEKMGPLLRNPEFLAAASDGFLMASVARGRRDTTMPPFGEHPDALIVLGPDQILDLVAYMRSWEAAWRK